MRRGGIWLDVLFGGEHRVHTSSQGKISTECNGVRNKKVGGIEEAVRKRVGMTQREGKNLEGLWIL